MSTVTEKDRHEAAAYWRRLLPERFRDLLDASRVGSPGASSGKS